MAGKKLLLHAGVLLGTLFAATPVFAGDADINLPALSDVSFYQAR